MAKTPSTLHDELEAGRYDVIVRAFYTRGQELMPTELGSVVSAFALLGQTQDAEDLLSSIETKLNCDERIWARYFLAVTQTRQLNHRRARELVIKNYFAGRRSANPDILAIVYLGIAIYRYLYGRIERALENSNQALKYATISRNTFLTFLAKDLLGHCQANSGAIHQGIQTLNHSHALAGVLGRGAMKQASETTVILYKSTMRLLDDPNGSLDSLLKEDAFDDAYMRVQIILEKVRNHFLQGECSIAMTLLNSERYEIFKRGNKRHMGLYYLRLAEGHYLAGESDRALQLIAEAMQLLGQSAENPDLRLETSLVGMRYKITQSRADLEYLGWLTRKAGSYFAKSVFGRLAESVSGYEVSQAEDPLGYLLSRIGDDLQWAVQFCIDKGLLGVLVRAIPEARTRPLIALDLKPGSCTVFSRGNVEHIPSLSPLQRRVLDKLAEGFATDESLIGEVWQERYSKCRHDKTLSSFFSRMRSSFPSLSEHIIRDDGVTVLTGRTKIINCSKVGKNESQMSTQAAEPSVCIKSLNFRQNIFLNEIVARREHGLYFSAYEYANKFNISNRTSQRDLIELSDRGFILKIGRGRRQKYQLNSETVGVFN